ncbi:MAG: hypothetical protein FK734_01875 [Asgard group archaeon]|nr:hypothetical protein [Asgard group archaeon]
MENVELTGTLSQRMNKYILTTDDGTEYILFSISPWEAVSPDFDTAKFAQFIGKKVKVYGRATGTEVWDTVIHSPDCEDTVPPGLPSFADLKKEK